MAGVLVGDDQRPVFVERSFVDQLVDAFADHAEPARFALFDSLFSVFVQGIGAAIEQFLQVGTDMVRVDFFRDVSDFAVHVRLFQQNNGPAFQHGFADRHCNLSDQAAYLGGDDMLHLHRLDDGDLRAFGDCVAFTHVDGNDGALDRGAEADCAIGHRLRRWGGGRGLRCFDLGVVGEEGERV